MSANLSKSSESMAPLQVAETILARYFAKASGSKDPQTSCLQVAEVPATVEHPEPALENVPEIEVEIPNKSPSSMAVGPTVEPSQVKTGQSSRQKGKAYTASGHASILNNNALPKPKYNEQKNSRGKSSYEFSDRSYKCGSRIGPNLFCEQLREPWHSYCVACEKRNGGTHYNTRSGGRGGPRGGPPRGGPRGGRRGGRGGRQGGRGFGRGNGIPA